MIFFLDDYFLSLIFEFKNHYSMPMDRLYRNYTIIVPSFNRVDEIKDLLVSVEALVFNRNQFELIIVDDGSTDNTIEFCRSRQVPSDLDFKFLTQENQGPGAARNKGMENATGDFFIFIDSDCTVPPHWLSEIDQQINAEKADAFGGPDSFHEDFSPLLKAINYSMTSFVTTGGLRGKKGRKLARFYPRSFNMGLSRKLWQKIGGFGSLRHGQDIEYSNRIIKSHARVSFVEQAFVYHKRRTNLRRFYRQVYNWGVARVNLYKIDHAMLEPLHAMPALLTLLTILILVLAIFIGLFRWMVLAGLIFTFLIVVYSIIDAIRIYKDIKPALLVPFIIPAQIFGYGLGFINNFIRRVVFQKEEKVGFQKTYYK